jgi:hypothetical protein
VPWVDKETKRLANLRWKAKNPGHWRDRQLRKKYGISWAEYQALFARQGGLCAICGTDKPGGRGLMAVDHDHKTGQIRGLLCNLCNRGLGQFRDNAKTLRNAAEYLEKASAYHA